MRAAFFLLACVLALLPVAARAQVAPRVIKITQVDAEGTAIGPIVDLYCPPSGCQEVLAISFENARETYTASIEVVQRGIYVALTSRTLGTTAVVDFETGQPGATFLSTHGRSRVVSVLKFNIVRDASVRAQRGFNADKQLGEGNVFNRNRAPDLFLNFEVLTQDIS